MLKGRIAAAGAMTAALAAGTLALAPSPAMAAGVVNGPCGSLGISVLDQGNGGAPVINLTWVPSDSASPGFNGAFVDYSIEYQNRTTGASEILRGTDLVTTTPADGWSVSRNPRTGTGYVWARGSISANLSDGQLCYTGPAYPEDAEYVN